MRQVSQHCEYHETRENGREEIRERDKYRVSGGKLILKSAKMNIHRQYKLIE